jgi:structural maintenance of chromosome 3 (chondroitin sulfate proteoglycan 6)
MQQHEVTLTKAKHALSTTSIALRQYESEMADLVRTRTEIECLIADFKAAQDGGEERRQELTDELEELEKKIGDATERLDALSDDLDQRIAEEREAKEA